MKEGKIKISCYACFQIENLNLKVFTTKYAVASFVNKQVLLCFTVFSYIVTNHKLNIYRLLIRWAMLGYQKGFWLPSNHRLLQIIPMRGLSFTIFKNIVLKVLSFECKGSLNIPELRCLLIGRVLQLYTMEHVVENIAYSNL